MMHAEREAAALGFYTVLETPDVGWTAGLLLLTPLGRPLEFHCTLPVRPTRTQSLLFGTSLREYLIGERLAIALLGRVRLQPQLLCVDLPAAESVRSHTSIPVLRVLSTNDDSDVREVRRPTLARSSDDASDDEHWSPQDHPEPSSRESASSTLWLGANRVETLPSDGSQRKNEDVRPADVASLWRSFDCQLDLAEPFERIRDALREAAREARQSLPRSQVA
jgi:hypothetical protein